MRVNGNGLYHKHELFCLEFSAQLHELNGLVRGVAGEQKQISGLNLQRKSPKDELHW